MKAANFLYFILWITNVESLKLTFEDLFSRQLDLEDLSSLAHALAPISVSLFNKRVNNTLAGDLRPYAITKSRHQHDKLGSHSSFLVKWHSPSWPAIPKSPACFNCTYFHTSIQYYKHRHFLIFRQTFPFGSKGCAKDLSKKDILATYPAFKLEQMKNLGFYTYQGLFLIKHQFGTFQAQASKLKVDEETGPMLLFTSPDLHARTAILSHFQEFLTQTIARTSTTLEYGPFGTLCDLPPQYEAATILAMGHHQRRGIGDTVKEWGNILRQQYAPSARQPHSHNSFRAEDFTTLNLGYSTDNGAYYYYKKAANTTNMEETMLAVKKHADNQSIPYKYWLLDSWWYYQEPRTLAVTNWTARPDVFPSGMTKLFERSQMFVQAHNRYWARHNHYMPKYKFAQGSVTALPIERRFWDDLFRSSVKWGLKVYEQDWLNQQFETLEQTYTDPTLVKTWLNQMHDAAKSCGITIQYCMPLARHVLASVEYPYVTQIRASDDYVMETQWNIGVTSLLHEALQLKPSKDSAWSQREQPGNKWHRVELYPDLQMVVMALSTGPVTFADRIGYSKRWRIMRTCREDGVLLQPVKPLVAIDGWFTSKVFGNVSLSSTGKLRVFSGHIQQTQLRVSGLPTYSVVLTVEVQSPLLLYPVDLSCCWHQEREYYQYSYDYTEKGVESLKVERFSEKSPIQVRKSSKDRVFTLTYIGGLLHSKWLILGELSKVVPISSQRLTIVSVSCYKLILTVSGAPEEKVGLYIGLRSREKINVRKWNIQIPQSGRVQVEMNWLLFFSLSLQDAVVDFQ